MAVDKRISVEPNEVGIGSIKRKKVEVIPFKPKPDSPLQHLKVSLIYLNLNLKINLKIKKWCRQMTLSFTSEC